jgi:hypothetical protein
MKGTVGSFHFRSFIQAYKIFLYNNLHLFFVYGNEKPII